MVDGLLHNNKQLSVTHVGRKNLFDQFHSFILLLKLTTSLNLRRQTAIVDKKSLPSRQ
jgi:hypothetical protein